MTLQEAILSGEKFRRPKYKHFLTISEDGRITWDFSDKSVEFHYNALIADDWELESDCVKINTKTIRELFYKHFPKAAQKRVAAFIEDLGNKNE